MSIQPSLSKSRAVTPAVGVGMSLAHGVVARKIPSRGFRNAIGTFCHPVTTKSIARSLFRSLPIAPIEGALPASPVSAVQLVNVPLPLFRHKTFPAGVASIGNENGSAEFVSGK